MNIINIINMSFQYVDIDSSYRNRNDYPNPADFVVLPDQNHSTTVVQFKNANSEQIVLYPIVDTSPIYFSPDGVQHRNLPYMFQTVEERIVQLDELVINPTHPDDVGEIIVSDTYPRGVIPLGQAEQFYAGDYLENVSTGESRKIVSFQYESGDRFVFQTSTVLWSTLIDEQLRVGVQTLSTLTIPISNIDNFYRGKYLRIITGRARNTQSLIVDYRAETDVLGVFTLESYQGILPQRGDVFQIVSDRRWFATLETPFTGDLSPYPGYQTPLPVADLQFNQNTIYDIPTNQTLTRLELNSDGNVCFQYDVIPLSFVEVLESLDSDNYFWDSPRSNTFNAIPSSSGLLYLGKDIYFYLLGTNTLAQPAYTLHRLNTETNSVENNVFSESVIPDLRPFSFQMSESFPYITTVLSIASAYTLILYDATNSHRTVLFTTTTTQSLVLHDTSRYGASVYVVWSVHTPSAQTLDYYYAQYEPSTQAFSVRLIVSQFISDSSFEHLPFVMRSYVWREQVIVPVLKYVSFRTPFGEERGGRYIYELYISESPTDFWFFCTRLFPDLTLTFEKVAESGLLIQEVQDAIFCFVWDKENGFGYSFTRSPEILYDPFFADKEFTPFVLVDTDATFVRILFSPDPYVVYTKNGWSIRTLHTQSFQITNAVQYRIRKNPYRSLLTVIPYTEDALQIEEKILLNTPYEQWIPSNLGISYPITRSPNPNNTIYYSKIHGRWILGLIDYMTFFNTVDDAQYIYSFLLQTDPVDLNVRESVVNITNPDFMTYFRDRSISRHFPIDVAETSGFNGLYLENGLTDPLLSPNNRVFSHVYLPGTEPEGGYIPPSINQMEYIDPFGRHFVLMYVQGNYLVVRTQTFSSTTDELGWRWVWYNLNTGLGLNLSDALDASLAYGNELFCIVGLMRDGTTPIILRSSFRFTWNYIVLPTSITDTFIPRKVIFCTEINIFIATGICFDSLGNRIVLIYSADLINWTPLTVPYFAGNVVFVDGAWSSTLGKAYFGSLADDFLLEYTHSPTPVVNLYTLPGISLYRMEWSPDLERFAAIAFNSDLYTSDNGLDWTLQVANNRQNNFINIVWSHDLRLFMAHTDNVVYISPLGTQWAQVPNLRLFGYYPEFVWMKRDFPLISESFVGFSNKNGLYSFMYNVTEARQYLYNLFVANDGTQEQSFIVKYFAPLPVTLYNAALSTRQFIPSFLNCIYVQKNNNFVAITSDRLYYSAEGNVWFEKTLFLIAGTPLTEFVAFLYIDELEQLCFLCQNQPYVFYLTDYIQDTVVGVYPFSPLEITQSPAKMAWSPSIGLLVALDKDTVGEVDYIRSMGTNLNAWEAVYISNQQFTTDYLIWDEYFSVYFTILTLDDAQYIGISQTGGEWFFFLLQNNQYISFGSSEGVLGLLGDTLTYFTLSYNLYIERLILPELESNQGQVWLYTRPSESSNLILNRIYNVFRVEGDIFRIETPVQLTIPYYIATEVLNTLIDSFQGRHEPFQLTQDRCYQIRLLDLVVPNKVIQSYIGNQISFYPFIYVTIQNETSNNYSQYTFITNNKNNTRATFKIAVSQFTNEPQRLPYIRLKSKTTIQSYFNLHKPFRFTIHLPNGEPLTFVEINNNVYDKPDPLAQISATFRFSKLN